MEISYFIRGATIVGLGFGFWYLSALALWDHFTRLRSVNYIGLGFFFIGLGTLSYIMRLTTSIPDITIVGLSSLLNSIGFFFVWIHFQFISKKMFSIPVFSILLIMLAVTSAFTVFHVLFLHQQIFIDLSIASLVILSSISLCFPIKTGISEYCRRRDWLSLIEGKSFLFLLTAVIGYSTSHFTKMTPLLWLSHLLLVISAGCLIGLYTWHPRLMHRIPFKVGYLLGLHDSGLFFFKKEVQTTFLKHDERTRKKMQYLSSIFSAIDTLFKHILMQDIVYTAQRSLFVEVLFIRDPKKQLGYILIAEKHSYYLKQALKILLKMTPRSLLLTDINDTDSVLIDQQRINEKLMPLVENIFPGLS